MGRIYLCDLFSIFISKMVSSVNKVEVNRENGKLNWKTPCLVRFVVVVCVWLCEWIVLNGFAREEESERIVFIAYTSHA